ncbi:unnamed protein product [Meloidogyne enterolobii]|uniref:Uncharacterized protein n=1 Tax=Meloidogyne enterolobii TaxID=390850 RepID=A0ACB0XUS0_MELEN
MLDRDYFRETSCRLPINFEIIKGYNQQSFPHQIQPPNFGTFHTQYSQLHHFPQGFGHVHPSYLTQSQIATDQSSPSSLGSGPSFPTIEDFNKSLNK